MTTTFMEPGGDSTITANIFWQNLLGSPNSSTDFVHGGHIRSMKYRAAQADTQGTLNGALADAGSRLSAYFYFSGLPTSSVTTMYRIYNSSVGARVSLRITSGGVLQLWNGASTAQIGINGATLSTGQWYRISLAYTITSSTVNRFELFVGGVSSISITNATIAGTGTNRWDIGNIASDTTMQFYSSDHYVDNSSSLTDPGQTDANGGLWVTAKRPLSNGTTNGFTTQIGSGGSGYGTGHAPQVNERPLSTTNGWSMVGSGSAITEEYTIEGASVGDIDISTASIIDFAGWVYCKALVAETGSLILAGSTSSISITTANKLFVAYAGSTSYPSGGSDIGIITSTAATTVSLYECGLIFAYINTSSFTQTLSGSISPTGALVPQTNKVLGGSISPAGALIKLLARIVGGSISPTGALVKQSRRSLGGSITPVGTLTKQPQKLLAGSLPSEGDLVKQTNKLLGGSISPTGTLAGIKVVFLILSGALSFTGTVIKQTSRVLAGSISPTGTLNKLLPVKILSGVLSFVGSLTATKNPVGGHVIEDIFWWFRRRKH